MEGHSTPLAFFCRNRHRYGVGYRGGSRNRGLDRLEFLETLDQAIANPVTTDHNPLIPPKSGGDTLSSQRKGLNRTKIENDARVIDQYHFDGGGRLLQTRCCRISGIHGSFAAHIFQGREQTANSIGISTDIFRFTDPPLGIGPRLDQFSRLSRRCLSRSSRHPLKNDAFVTPGQNHFAAFRIPGQLQQHLVDPVLGEEGVAPQAGLGDLEARALLAQQVLGRLLEAGSEVVICLPGGEAFATEARRRGVRTEAVGAPCPRLFCTIDGFAQIGKDLLAQIQNANMDSTATQLVLKFSREICMHENTFFLLDDKQLTMCNIIFRCSV